MAVVWGRLLGNIKHFFPVNNQCHFLALSLWRSLSPSPETTWCPQLFSDQPLPLPVSHFRSQVWIFFCLYDKCYCYIPYNNMLDVCVLGFKALNKAQSLYGEVLNTWVKIKNACLKGKWMTTFKLVAEIHDHKHLYMHYLDSHTIGYQLPANQCSYFLSSVSLQLSYSTVLICFSNCWCSGILVAFAGSVCNLFTM